MANKEMNRRDFLLTSGMIGVGLAAGSSFLSSCSKKTVYTPLREAGTYYIPYLEDKAIPGREIKVGVIGCGGRGSGAALNVIDAADNVKITALADVFADRIESLRKKLKEKTGQEVADENCFVGFESYKQLLDTDVDYVIFTAPPVFRPDHFKYAVEKGKHCFLEKPIAVDSKGYRSIMASAKQAAARNLVVICGTQRHHQRPYVEAFEKISQGMIGEITGGNVYWNQSMLWYKNRDKKWSDMEWMIRDWVNWTWLSGDHICEQHVHNIDVFLWMSGYKVKSATAFGSRQRRVTGDQYDNFSTDYVCENGVHFHSMCRQINGCTNRVGEEIFGTLGSWNSFDHEIKDREGNVIWKFDKELEDATYKQKSPYVLEHSDAITKIRQGVGLDEAQACAISSLVGVMGRESAYTGKTVTWDEISQSDLDLMPEKLEIGPMDMSKYTVKVPGSEQKK